LKKYVGFFYTKWLTCEFVTRIIGARVKISHKSCIFRLLNRSIELNIQSLLRRYVGVHDARQQLLEEG